MNQSNPLARFSSEDGLQTLLKEFQNSPDKVKKVESLHLVYDEELKDIITRSVQQDDSTDELITKLKGLRQLSTLSDNEFTTFKYIVQNQLKKSHISEDKGQSLPTILMLKEDEVCILYNNHAKKKAKFDLQQLSEISKVLPRLKNIKFNNLKFKVERSDLLFGSETRSSLQSVDISTINHIESPSSLLQYFLENNHATLKSLRLSALDTKHKWSESSEEEDDNGVSIQQLTVNKIKLDQLESLEINYFRYLIKVSAVLDVITLAGSKLKHLTLLGCVQGKAVLDHITKSHGNTLESLKLSTQEYMDPSPLKCMKKLKHFSYTWDTSKGKLDILKFLMMLPQLKSLELGTNKGTQDLVSNVINLESYPNLQRLSLVGSIMQGNELSNLEDQLPHIQEINLTHCRIVKNRQDDYVKLDLGGFSLEKLTMDACCLFYSKKEAKKLYLSQFKFDLQSTEAGTLVSRVNDTVKKGSLSSDNTYAYKNSTFTPTENCVWIVADSIKRFSCSPHMVEYVSFTDESEDESMEDSENEGLDEDALIKEAEVNEIAMHVQVVVEEEMTLISEDNIEENSLINEVVISEVVDIELEQEIEQPEQEVEESEQEVEESEQEVEEADQEVEESEQEPIEQFTPEDAHSTQEEIEEFEREAIVEIEQETTKLQQGPFSTDDEDEEVLIHEEYQSGSENSVGEGEQQDESEDNQESSNSIEGEETHLPKEQKSDSDVDYNEDKEEEVYSSSDSDNYSEDDENPVRRSTRKFHSITANSLRTRKRRHSLTSSNEEDSDAEDDMNGDDDIGAEIVNQVMRNVKRFKICVNALSRPSNPSRSPSL